MKPVRFVGSAKNDLAAFPKSARARVGTSYSWSKSGAILTIGNRWPALGPGACESRVREPTGAYRVIYVAKFTDAVYVLHAFQKQTQMTARADLDLAQKRYRIARELAEGANYG